jgi:hypothetical protein
MYLMMKLSLRNWTLTRMDDMKINFTAFPNYYAPPPPPFPVLRVFASNKGEESAIFEVQAPLAEALQEVKRNGYERALCLVK